MESIYFDYAASNPLDPRVATAMVESLELVGNPSALHASGRKLKTLIDDSRTAIADLLGVTAGEITFTSGATEANNTVLIGYFRRLRELYGAEKELRLLVSPIEHSSIRGVLGRLETEFAVRVDKLPVDNDGVIKIEKVAARITDSTVMVCVMWVNNIIGSLQPIAEIGHCVAAARVERKSGALPLVFMSDAVQALRTIDVRPAEVDVDLLTLSAHKIYGPKGCGALYIRKGVQVAPLLSGGEQESGQRAGTENVSGIAGIGAAARLLAAERAAERQRLTRLMQMLREGVRELPGMTVIGDSNRMAPGILYVVSNKIDGDTLVLKLDAAGIAVSSGSACDAGTRKTADVLAEVCSGAAIRRGGVRLSIGRFTTDQECTDVLSVLKKLTD